MHILYVTRELGIYKNTGGIGAYVWDIARRIVQLGHKCTVICSSYDPNKTEEQIIEGVKVIKLPDDQLSHKNKAEYFLNFRKNFLKYRHRISNCLDNILEHEKVDIVEFAEFGAESIIWQKKKRNIPIVIRWHTPIGKQFKIKNIIYYPFKKWIDSMVLESLLSADLVTFPSQWMADRVNEAVIPLDKLKYKVIPNGINYSDWQSVNENSLLINNHNSFKVLFVGTLEARKGFVDLINAVKILRKEHSNIELYLVGKHSQYSKRILNKEKQHINKGWLKVKGALPREELKNYYYLAEVVCFPSWFENAPIVCLEAMACGSIVIGSSNSGMAEIIRDGIDGFLVEPKKPPLLAECIKKVMNLSDERKRAIKEEAKKRISEKYDNSVIIPQMIEIYNGILIKKVDII